MSDTHDNQNYDSHPGEEPPIETEAMVLRDPNTPPSVKRESVTPAQAKVDAIANLTMKAYENASTLSLTKEECDALKADFPDEAFKPGAAGKENLIYLEHAFLRERLNNVFGLGQWSIIPRSRWGEDFIVPASRDRAEQPATRIYVEAMLVIRGCFVAEAVGDMVYYPKNQSQNYGDAVEGAKTAALRRCTKELGIGLQAYKKDWCEGWWARKRPQGASGSRPPQPAAQRQNAAPAPQSTPRPPARTSDVVPPPASEATEDQKTRFLALFPGTNGEYALKFFVSKGWIPNAADFKLTDLPLKYVPTTKKTAEDLVAQVEAFSTQPPPGEVEAWRKYLMPWGKNKDTALADLDKNYLYGLVMNYEVEREYNGTPKKDETIAKDEEFRRMLDDAGRHYEWIKTEPEKDPF